MNIKESYEGIETADITLSGGEVRVVASDDGVNASDGSGSSEGPGGMFGGQRPEGMPGQPLRPEIRRRAAIRLRPAFPRRAEAQTRMEPQARRRSRRQAKACPADLAAAPAPQN